MERRVRISWLLDFYGDLLTAKQKKILDLHYNDDLSLGEIAEHEKISRQGVYDTLKRGESLLIDMENRLRLLQRHLATSQLLQRCLSYIEDIKVHGNSRGHLDKMEKEIVDFIKDWEDEYGL
ncbi:MAG: putative DNA-binding protein [Clostridia bacterium]